MIKNITFLLFISGFYFGNCQENSIGFFRYYEIKDSLFIYEKSLFEANFETILKQQLPHFEIKSIRNNIKKSKISDRKVFLEKLNAKDKLRLSQKFNLEIEKGIEEIYKKDQNYRKKRKKNVPWDNSVDSMNVILLKNLITEFGLPSYTNSSDQTINHFGVILSHLIFDSSLVTVEKVDYYFENGSITPLMAAMTIDKYVTVILKKPTYFNLFSHQFNLTKEDELIYSKRRRKYGIMNMKFF